MLLLFHVKHVRVARTVFEHAEVAGPGGPWLDAVRDRCAGSSVWIATGVG